MCSPNAFPGRAGLVQLALSAFRAPVVETLAQSCEKGLAVFSGERRAGERKEPAPNLVHATHVPARNLHLLGGRFETCWQRGMIDWLEDWQPDILLAEANPRYLATRRGASWMRRRNRPVMGWGLGTMRVVQGGLPLRDAIRRRYLSIFDGLLAYSSRAADEYAALGFPREKIFVAHNACTFAPSGPAPQREHDTSGPPVVLSVGRINAGKRVDLLIRACAALPSELAPRLRIVGDGPAKAELEALARDVYPRTEFLGGVFGDALTPIFRSADLFVMPGLGGLAVQQAMSHALPIVVGEGDGTQLDLVSEGNGWHVAPGDLDDLVRTMTDALSDRARLTAMGVESYRVIAEDININRMVERITTAMNTIAGGR